MNTNKKRHRLYHTWYSMVRRTTKPNRHRYISYGGRGIKVCDRWLDFNNFVEDMYPTFEEGLTLDRIDNDGNYEPSNCRWATKEVQQRNSRKIQANNTSGYRGVIKAQTKGKWIAQIKVNMNVIYIGTYESAIDASIAYDDYIVSNSLEHTKNSA